MAVNPIRDGFHTVTPYLFSRDAAGLLTFLQEAFEADVLYRKDHDNGNVMHAEVRIGNSMVMVGEGSGEFGPMPTSIYLYVTDCDAVYRQAIEKGGVSIFEMMDMPSGERYGGVKDPSGNIWWIATHVEDLTPEEEEKRWSEFKR